MKKESKASKIAGGFNDGLDIEKLANVASQIAAPTTPSVSAAKIVEEEDEKKDRRFTIILPHDLYMKMVVKTKTKGISFTKYIHQIMQNDLG